MISTKAINPAIDASTGIAAVDRVRNRDHQARRWRPPFVTPKAIAAQASVGRSIERDQRDDENDSASKITVLANAIASGIERKRIAASVARAVRTKPEERRSRSRRATPEIAPRTPSPPPLPWSPLRPRVFHRFVEIRQAVEARQCSRWSRHSRPTRCCAPSSASKRVSAELRRSRSPRRRPSRSAAVVRINSIHACYRYSRARHRRP